MAVIKPLQLKQERVERSPSRALSDPYARILVDHPVVHLDQVFDYAVPEALGEKAKVGCLVEVEFGHTLTQGIVLERLQLPTATGEIKNLRKVLSTEPYVIPDQLDLIFAAAELYGSRPWDILRSTVPPFSKVGERDFITRSIASSNPAKSKGSLPASLRDFLRSPDQSSCAIELPVSTPYWEVVSEIALERVQYGSVLLLLPNEREVVLLDRALRASGQATISILAAQVKSERYCNFLESRTAAPKIILGLRSSALLSLPSGCTIILLDDVDESHYERQAPTWNSRSLLALREKNHPVIYASSSVSLEIAARVKANDLPYYRFPTPPPVHFHSATSTEKGSYFEIIGNGLEKGSVLISVGVAGYVSAFSCQKCRNLALCSCGGRLYFPARSTNPLCSTCSTEFIEWVCDWCGDSKPRIVRSGVVRRAEEFGRAFPHRSVIHSSAQHPVAYLPEGNHIVLSTPGVEPRGRYSAEIFLDLEGRLLRTTLRATEEMRFHLQRTLSMLQPSGVVYLDLPPSDSFLQSILRSNPLLAADREIEERTMAELMPVFTNMLLTGEPLESVQKILTAVEGVELIGPFLRKGKKSALLKAPKDSEAEIIKLLKGLNRIQSMRKEGLLTYLINPYSLN